MAGSPLLVILRKAVGGEELGVGADCGGRSLGKGPVRVGKSLGEGRLTGRILQNSGEEGLVGAWERLWLRCRGARGRAIGRCGADGEQLGGDNRLDSSFSSSAGQSAGVDARRNGGGRCLGEGQLPAWGQWGGGWGEGHLGCSLLSAGRLAGAAAGWNSRDHRLEECLVCGMGEEGR